MAGEDTVTLGSSIELSGFKDVDGATMIVVKKMVGSYVKNISEKAKKFKKINISLDTKDDSNFQLKVTLVDGSKEIHAEDSSNNLFFGLDKVLKKAELEI